MQDDVEEQLRELLAHRLKIDKALITHGSKMQDWGGDSLAFIEATFDIETHFDISLPDTRDGLITTFDGLVQLIKGEVAKKSKANARP